MRISTKGRYALRLMLDLAMADPGEYVSMKKISSRQEISNKYLEQIISQLYHADFVKSARGASGGYMLARDPQEYTVGSILRLMEGSLAPVSCLDDVIPCPRKSRCATITVWEELNLAINGVVDHITLADLVIRQNKINS